MTDRTHPDSGRITGGIVEMLQARIAELEAQLETIGAGGVTGPLIGQPSGAGEAAEHYRNAIASACEGWAMPDGLRKHLETALWSPPTPQPMCRWPSACRCTAVR